jgi:uncharacterized cupin superfamily protein
MESTIFSRAVIPFHTVFWEGVSTTEHQGEHGRAIWRTLELPNLRLRVVEYSPGYLANHWCTKGHILYVLEGEITTELQSGERVALSAGMSYQVSDEVSAHRSYSEKGAKLFIVDGDFLKIKINNATRGVWM